MNRIPLRRAAAGAVLATALVSSVFVTTAVAQGPDDSPTSASARHHEAGDDHGRDGGRHHGGRHHEAGDDHGRDGARHHRGRHQEAGDDHGRGGRHQEAGDDHGRGGRHHEAGDDHGGR